MKKKLLLALLSLNFFISFYKIEGICLPPKFALPLSIILYRMSSEIDDQLFEVGLSDSAKKIKLKATSKALAAGGSGLFFWSSYKIFKKLKIKILNFEF